MSGKVTPGPGGRESGAALLLPGMTLNGSIFPSLPIPTLDVSFPEFVVGPDGSSPDLERRRMRLYVDRLENRLGQWDAWAIRPRIVVGHSFGGMVALAWLAARGATVRTIDGVILIATTAGPIYDAVSLRIARIGGREIRLPVRRLMGWWNRPRVTRMVKRVTSRGRLDADPVDFQALRWRSDLALDLAGWRNTDWRAMRSYRIAMEGFDVRDLLPRIAVRTIVLHGSDDSLLPVDRARELANGLPNARLHIVEGAGHGLPLTHPDVVREAVAELVGSEE